MTSFAKHIVAVLVLVQSIGGVVDGAKILAVYTSHSNSHLIFSQNLLKHLVKIGHEVTVVSPFPLDPPLKGYRDIVAPIGNEFQEILGTFTKGQQQGRLKYVKSMFALIMSCIKLSNDSINTNDFRRIMREETFDLVVLPFYINDFQVGLGAHFKCPVIIVSSLGTFHLLNTMIGNPSAVAITPNMVLKSDGPMNFRHRVLNFLFETMSYLMLKAAEYQLEKYYTWNFPQPQYPTYQEAKSNVAMVFVNQHFSEGAIRPFIPNMVEVGGLQMKPTPEPLSKNIQKWLDEAENGAIWFSLGTNVKISEMSPEKLDILFNTLAKLKERVLLKWESGELPRQLANVMAVKWVASQSDVLAHRNIKLFITHGGLGSVVEAKYHGIPLVVIPFFGDQSSNANAVVKEGWAVKVDFDTMTETVLTESIREMADNRKYSDIVRGKSELYRDRPMDALSTATYWIEYVIRHKGAKHMRYPGVDLNLFERNSLDVIAFLLAILYLLLRVLKFIVCTMFKMLKRRKSKSKKDN